MCYFRLQSIQIILPRAQLVYLKINNVSFLRDLLYVKKEFGISL